MGHLFFRSQHKMKSKGSFLALIGAQGVTLSVCPSVCLSGTSLSRVVYLYLSRSEIIQSHIVGALNTASCCYSFRSWSHLLSSQSTQLQLNWYVIMLEFVLFLCWNNAMSTFPFFIVCTVFSIASDLVCDRGRVSQFCTSLDKTTWFSYV